MGAPKRKITSAQVTPLTPKADLPKPQAVRNPAQIKERICEAFKVGVSIEAAANWAGVSKDTYYRWRNADPEFAAAADLALSGSEVQLVTDIRADGSWQSKAWLLERRWPERYGRMERKPEADNSGSGKVVLTWGDDDQ